MCIACITVCGQTMAIGLTLSSMRSVVRVSRGKQAERAGTGREQGDRPSTPACKAGIRERPPTVVDVGIRVERAHCDLCVSNARGCLGIVARNRVSQGRRPLLEGAREHGEGGRVDRAGGSTAMLRYHLPCAAVQAKQSLTLSEMGGGSSAGREGRRGKRQGSPGSRTAGAAAATERGGGQRERRQRTAGEAYANTAHSTARRTARGTKCASAC